MQYEHINMHWAVNFTIIHIGSLGAFTEGPWAYLICESKFLAEENASTTLSPKRLGYHHLVIRY